MAGTVIKAGGSLLDLPDLSARLAAYLDAVAPGNRFLIVGGGRPVDRIRFRDQHHSVRAEDAHWLAIRLMSRNTRRVAAQLGIPMVLSLSDVRHGHRPGRTAALHAFRLLREDETRGGAPLPRSWTVTSDSIAAHLARRLGASTLLLLKSCCLPPAMSLEQAVRAGLVDEYLPRAANGLCVRMVAFRHEPSEICRLAESAGCKRRPADTRWCL